MGCKILTESSEKKTNYKEKELLNFRKTPKWPIMPVQGSAEKTGGAQDWEAAAASRGIGQWS